MTPELKKRLAQNKTAKEMQFEALKAHLLDLFEHHDFPLPEALSEQQYGDLMKIHDNFNRLQYLDAVLKNAPDLDQTLQNIISKDELELQCLSITDEQRARLTKGSPSRNEGIDKILHRAEILYQSGQYVPCQLSDLHWCQLLDNYTDRALSKFFEFRLKTKHSKTIELMKKIQARSTTEQHRQNKAEKEEKTTSSPMVYGLTENCIFLRLSKSRMFQIGNWRAINEFKEWGQPLVLDFGMVKVMSMKDAKSVMMREVSIAISVNRASRSPFAIYVCNFDWNCPRCRFLIQFVPGIDKPESPVHITEQSYLDLFPKERLLYLTPNSRVDLMNYDDDDIYIIGALHDGLGKVPRTLSKSLEQGIRHARIPLRKVIG